MSEYKQILNLSMKRRATLIKRLDQARAKGNDSKCDQIYYLLSVEVDNIAYCMEKLEALK